MSGSFPQLKETAKAAQAFADYVALGPSRSLRSLHTQYCQQTDHEPPTKRFKTLAEWSVAFHWQARIRDTATARSTAMLEEASELDAETFLHTSRHLNESIKDTANAHEQDDIIRIRETVRKPAAKGGTSVSVNVSVEVRELAEQLAKAAGIDADELIADAERIASGAWGEG